MPRNSTSSMEDAFLQTILDLPDDDAARLVFADWLEEQGNPRGTFIRLQCARAKLTRFDPGWKELLSQEAALLRAFEVEWSMQVLRYVDEVQFRRGFIEHVRVSASKLLRHADKLFRVAPVSSVRLEKADLLAEIAGRPWLARVRELDLHRNPLGRKSLQTLFESEFCKSLTALNLGHCHVGLPTIQAIAAAPNLSSLRKLNLAGNPVDVHGVIALSANTHLSNLEDLNLHLNDVQAAGVAALASSSVFRLKRLAIGQNRLGNEGVAEIARSAAFVEMSFLDAQSNGISNTGIAALVDSPHLRRLEYLDLLANRINSRGIQLLTDSDLLRNLTYLNLKNNEIDRPTLQTLPQRLQTPKMRELLI